MAHDAIEKDAAIVKMVAYRVACVATDEPEDGAWMSLEMSRGQVGFDCRRLGRQRLGGDLASDAFMSNRKVLGLIAAHITALPMEAVTNADGLFDLDDNAEAVGSLLFYSNAEEGLAEGSAEGLAHSEEAEDETALRLS